MALTKEEQLNAEWTDAWEALAPIRTTWTEKEQALLAQTNDSFSGNVTYARVTDAALSTLAFERQARVAAQLPTGRVLATNKADSAKAKLLNVILNRYIIPNANSQHSMLIKLRLWGVYSSVYGSMPMFYDYRVDDRYIGPECYLVDPRCFALQPGMSSVQDADYAFVSNVVSLGFIEGILKRSSTTWNKTALKEIAKEAKDSKSKPTRDNDSDKESTVQNQRYDKSRASGRIEFVTKYESGEDGHWITFAPDFENKIVRDIPNPHKSGKIPIVMRHCFPLLNSIFGLGDYERGMRIQKAKDSFTNLALEGAKNRIFPPLKMNPSQVTASTIKNQANSRWIVSNMAGVEPVNYGPQPINEFQAVWGSLQSMLMNQFGTTDTSVNQADSGNPAFGKTPQALQQLNQRQNARDTWDRFMHEQATEELFEGLVNLLTVKMESPINFSVFEEDIKQLEQEFGREVDPQTGQPKDFGLTAFLGKKEGVMSVSKKQVKGHQCNYIIDANSSMAQNAQEQFAALSQTWQIANADPNLAQTLQTAGIRYDKAEHLKAMFVAAGVTDWDKILQEQQEGQQPQQPQMDPAMMQAMMQQQAQAQGKSPKELINYKDAPPDVKAQMEQEAGFQPSMQHGNALQTEALGHAMQQQAAQNVYGRQQENPMFDDPEIAEVAQRLMGGR